MKILMQSFDDLILTHLICLTGGLLKLGVLLTESFIEVRHFGFIVSSKRSHLFVDHVVKFVQEHFLML